MSTAAAHYEQAQALLASGDHDGAWHAAQAALQLDPQSHILNAFIATLCVQRGRPLLAQQHLRKALSLAPQYREGWINLALAHLASGEAELAAQALQEALAIDPNDRRAASNLLLTLQYLNGPSMQQLREAAAQRARCYGSEVQREWPVWTNTRRLRVGYLSSDFYQHPVGTLSLPILCAHDPAQVEVHVFADRAAGDALTARLKATVEHWHDVHTLDDAALHALLVQQQLDVLVDLNGHTHGGRLGVFAQRAAPVQLSWLGYMASTGLATIDGVLLPSVLAPAEADAAFCEPLLRLPTAPFCFEPPDCAPPVAAPPSERTGHVTFGSFNNTSKLNMQVLYAWARILQQVPGSRLVLKWRGLDDPTLAARLRQTFALHGITADRIDCRGASVHAELLAQYGDIDIALDPFPFTGGLTTCEALWMGVPVVSLVALRPLARQGLGILQCVGLSEWCATTPAGYVQKAVALAHDATERAALRGELRTRMQSSALSDGSAYARALEAAYRQACLQVHSDARVCV